MTVGERLRWFLGLLLPVMAVLADVVVAAPQTFNTALPVAEGNFVLRGQFSYINRAGQVPVDPELDIVAGAAILGYGFTSRTALFGVLPYVHKSLDQTSPSDRRFERDANGLGDARFFVRHTVFRDDAPGRTFRIAPFAGIEAPTGEDDARDRFGRLPQPLQPGSGSWDGFGGVVATWQTLDYQIDAQLAYQANQEANDFEFGDVFRFDTALQYRLWPRQLDSGLPGFLYAGVETNLIHRDRNMMGARSDPDSGGTTLFISPGLQYVTRKWVLEAVVQLPAVQDANGDAIEDEFIIQTGFRMNF